ncbi:MAG: ClpXP protease specificity-enhancing factor [Rhodoferax sp.]
MATNGESSVGSTRPYMIRAIHEWCTDNGLTPYISVDVDPSVQVPREFVRDGEIVLNVSYDATTGLVLGNDFLEFKARFSGVVRDILIPVDRVTAVFARENGQGMAFPKAPRVSLDVLPSGGVDRPGQSEPADPQEPGGQSGGPPAPSAGRPFLKRVK